MREIPAMREIPVRAAVAVQVLGLRVGVAVAVAVVLVLVMWVTQVTQVQLLQCLVLVSPEEPEEMPGMPVMPVMLVIVEVGSQREIPVVAQECLEYQVLAVAVAVELEQLIPAVVLVGSTDQVKTEELAGAVVAAMAVLGRHSTRLLPVQLTVLVEA